MITETIDEMLDGIDLNIEYVEVELVDGEKVTIPKTEYEKLKEEEKTLKRCLFY